jgi:hypothetical protein
MIKTLSVPFRMALRFPLVQFAAVIALILLLQSADGNSVLGGIFSGLDALVDDTIRITATVITVKSFTKSWLTFAFMIAYVYVACWLILSFCTMAIRWLVDVAGRHNFLWLRNPIARQRGISAYRAWLPLERIRPGHVSQREWEERFAWPANNEPPYQPLGRRLLWATMAYAGTVAMVLIILQIFSPFPVLNWLGAAASRLTGL